VYFCVVLYFVCFLSFSVLFVCICVLNYCHQVATQLQLKISYHIIVQILVMLDTDLKVSFGCHVFVLIVFRIILL